MPLLRASTRRARRVGRIKPVAELRDLVDDPEAPVLAIAESARRARLSLTHLTKRSEAYEPLLDDLTVEINALLETVRELEEAARSNIDITNAVVAFLIAVKRVEAFGDVDGRERRPR